MDSMLYWRRDSFAKLSVLQDELSGEPALAGYCEYLRLLEQGRRKEALREIDPLLATLRTLSESKRRALASLILRSAESGSGHCLIPHPLYEGFIRPVLDQWRCEQPNDPEPLRWTYSIDDLAKALELDPGCDYTRRKLVIRILGFIGDTAHELPVGYLGDVRDDLGLIALARKEAGLIVDPDVKARCLQIIEEDENELKAFAESLASGPVSDEITRMAREC